MINAEQATVQGGRQERRNSERIYIPFPATVEGVDIYGEEFKVETVLDNLCKGGLYLRMVPCVKEGARLSILFSLSNAATMGERAQRFLVRGVVIRSEDKPGGACGVAVKYNPARYL